MKYPVYRMSLCYYCKNNNGYTGGLIDCKYEKKKLLPRMSTCAAQFLTAKGWKASHTKEYYKYTNIDKDLLKIYRDILIKKLRIPDIWKIKTPYHTDVFYSCIGIDNGDYESNIIFEIFEGKIYIKLNGKRLYHFSLYKNWDLLYYFIKLKLNIKKMVSDLEIESKEDILKNSLPDIYKRKLKISKIKRKI